MNFLYNLSIFIYLYSIKLAALFNPKARLWVEGRRNIFDKIREKINGDKNIIWFHCASLGEFEQGRPLIERIKKQHTKYKILITFFSPSGYEIRKSYELADYVFYLPIDSSFNAKTFVEIVNPVFVIFVKYEFWFNYIESLYQKKIPIFLISAIFRQEQHFFKWYGSWFRKKLFHFKHLFVQNNNSKALLEGIGFKDVSVCGDTRFDRVFEIAKTANSFPLIEKFIAGKNVLIAGSTWPPDELLLLDIINKKAIDVKFIIAPHVIDEKRIISFMQQLPSKAIRFSTMIEEDIVNANVLIIDTIGVLSQIYRYGSIAYIGGGFGKNIHNIQEPITFGLPVLFGPKYKNFNEAVDLVESQGAFCVNDSEDLGNVLKKLLSNPEAHLKSTKVCLDYVAQNIGATAKIEKMLPL